MPSTDPVEARVGYIVLRWNADVERWDLPEDPTIEWSYADARDDLTIRQERSAAHETAESFLIAKVVETRD